MNKGKICKDHGIDLLIDDFYEYALECVAVGVPVILFNTQWNDMLPLKKGMHRAANWPEILEIVNNL